MDEHPAKALREKKDSTILVATDLVKHGRADAVVTAGHTGAGMAAAVLRLGRLPGVDRPALAVQMITDAGPLVLLDIGANPDSSPRTSPSTPGWARSSPSACSAWTSRASRCSRSARRRARATLRIQQATELLDATDLHFVGNVEGKDLTKHLADVVVCDAVARQRRDQVLRGPVDLHLRPVPDASSAARSAGRLAYLLLRPGIGRIRDGLRLRAGRRLAAARRQGHGDHHPRPGEAADDRLRRRGRGDDGPDARPGAASPRHFARRRGRRRRRPHGARARPPDEPQPAWSPPRERPRADRRPGRHRRDGPARRARGPGRRSASARGGPAWRALLAGPPVVDSRLRTTASGSGSGSSPGRATRSCRSTDRSGRPSAPRSSGSSASSSESVTVTVDGVGG